jgi:hypothetical protein
MTMIGSTSTATPATTGTGLTIEELLDCALELVEYEDIYPYESWASSRDEDPNDPDVLAYYEHIHSLYAQMWLTLGQRNFTDLLDTARAMLAGQKKRK